MKLYLASPFFNEEELRLYRRAVEKLRLSGYDVFVPQEHSIEGAWEMSNEDWAGAVCNMDVNAICDCDVVIVLNFGLYSDSGTAWEEVMPRHSANELYKFCAVGTMPFTV